MKINRIFSILLVSTLILSFSLVTALPVMAATITVPDDYGTIQDAIDNAAAGDVIEVKVGTYAEDLVINVENLELKPFADDAVIIKGVQMTPSSSWPLAAPNIEILSDGVKIYGFTIQGPDPSEGNYSSGMVIGGANAEVYDNDFQVTNATSSTDDISQAIQTYHELAVPGVDISGLNIHDNTFTHYGAGTAGYEGIYINRDAETDTVTIEDNQFMGNVLRAITTERSNTDIDGTSIVTDLAPGLPGGYVGILVRDSSSGAGTQDAVNVTGNTVKGSVIGQGFLTGILIGTSGQALTNITVHCNTVELNTVGIKVRSSANEVVVNCNNIDKNTTFGVENTDDANTLDATMNWWGDVSGPSGSGPGTGDAVSDYVDYDPWSYTPDPCCPKTLGFWKNHPESIDALLGSIVLGDTYMVTDATGAVLVFDSASGKYAENMLAAQLLAAKLNVAHLTHLGIDVSCISSAIADADAALSGYTGPPVTDGTKGKDKQAMLAIADLLDDFNNGEACGCLCEWN